MNASDDNSGAMHFAVAHQVHFSQLTDAVLFVTSVTVDMCRSEWLGDQHGDM